MKRVSWVLSHVGLLLIRFLAYWPLPVLRGLGAVLAIALFKTLRGRRTVAIKNLAVAFPELSVEQQKAMAQAHFVAFMQAGLDRAWLWHGPAWLTRRRLRIRGAVQELVREGPVILFAPHFVGLDAAGIALTQQIKRPLAAIYTNQTNPVVDAWAFSRRQRFGNMHLFDRGRAVTEILGLLKKGGMLALSPDMGFGVEQSLFIPFFNVVTTTSPSLSRFARLSKARVVPLLAIMTPSGYDIQLHAPLQDFPSRDTPGDALRMNQLLESYIRQYPIQYYWVHRRYKHRPPGEPSIYA